MILKSSHGTKVDVRRAIVINYFTCVATAWLNDFSNFNASLPHLGEMIHWSLPMGIMFLQFFCSYR